MSLKMTNQGAVQGFAPDRIATVTTIDVTTVIAIRVPAPASYQINGVGVAATMPIGVTTISNNVTSIKFTAATTIEIMDI